MQAPLRTGRGEAGEFVGQVAETLAAQLGFDPIHGTLNVEASPPEPSVRLDEIGDEHCDGVDLTPCYVYGVRAAVVRPLVPGYPDRKVELVAPVHLRTLFGLDPGDTVEIQFDGRPWPTDASVECGSLDAFEAVVLDASVATEAVLDTLGDRDCRVAVRGPTDEGPSPTRPDATDGVVGGGDAALRDWFDRLDATPGNSVLVTDDRDGAELAHEVGTSVLRYGWL